MRRTILALIAALLFCLDASAQINPGDMPPAAVGIAFGGSPVSLAPLHGKVVVISFWATWCGYCMQELPQLAKLQLLATERGLPLQVVAVNEREDRDTFLRTSRLLHKRLPSLLVSWDRDGEVGKPYGAGTSLPVMVMLHRDGTMADVHVGYADDMLDSLLAQISAMLNEPAPPAVAAAR